MKAMLLIVLIGIPAFAASESTTYRRLKAHLDAVPAIDTHNHIMPFETLRGRVQTEAGMGMTLFSLWQSSYYTWFNPLTPWPNSGKFEDWWPKAKADFANARATSFYRYQLPAFTDLYGVDFDTISDEQARELNGRIFANYENPRWLHDVITNRANIELMLIDPYWARFKFTTSYPFEVLVFNVTTLVRGFNPAEFNNPWDSPWRFTNEEKLKVESLDDYLVVLDRLFQKAKAAGAVCLKTTLAYERTLNFENATKEAAAKAFGRSRDALTAAERKAFEDFVMWRLVELSAK